MWALRQWTHNIDSCILAQLMVLNVYGMSISLIEVLASQTDKVFLHENGPFFSQRAQFVNLYFFHRSSLADLGAAQFISKWFESGGTEWWKN